MNNIERDIKILKKLLNSKLFLNKFPIISSVSVDRYGNGIDIVLFLNNTKEYWDLKGEISNYIWQISKSASVESHFRIYP
jgi:hypothetical protein